ncbi:Ig-like domain-containing protein [Dyella tabacisoli]|uniref:Tandem-95 repeat protein n=1 Tax=Dyella tabacisoli TaxID=2282381 RepID=A0A369UKK4_9GAMM|nr:Ig-like domain-containing protein [Dyella tabacisoli]RDD81071.1 tandem-95 repeat protein [Dyella tabacisoli]
MQGFQTVGSTVGARGFQARFLFWFAMLVLCAGMLLPVTARAACTNPIVDTVASGGTLVIDENTCSPGGITATGSQPAHGTLVVDQTANNLTYVNNGDSSVTDSFTFMDDNSIVVTVNLTIGAGGSTPITIGPATLPSGTVGSAYPTTNLTASGGNGGPYTYFISAGNLPAGLTDSLGGVPGALGGTPTEGGSFTFTVTASDGVHDGTRTYTLNIGGGLTVSPPSGALTAIIGTAYNQPITATGGTGPYTVALLLGGTLPAGITLTGNALVGTPTALGASTFSLKVTDSGSSVSEQVNYTLTVNNPPKPVANNVSATVAFGSSANPITLNISGGTPTSVAVATAASHGTATASGTSITYTPSGAYSGSDTFTYTATNAGGTSAPATVTITVSPPPVPVANAVSATVAYGSTSNPITLNITGLGVTSVAVASAAGNGTATASGTTITYTPGATYSGPDSFTYTATNAGGTSAPATVTITVTPQPPVTGAVSVSVLKNSTNNPVTLALSGGAAASVAVASAATHGTATASGTSITYTPASNYVGSDSFTYTATNAGGTSTPATVTVTVNQPVPVANAVSATVAYGSSANPITLNISGGTPTSVAVATAALHGTAIASGTSITYTPSSTYSSSDTFTYTATNVSGTSAPATVTITVTPPPIPVANAVSATVAYGSSANPITLNITGLGVTSVAVASAAGNGTATASGTTITYTPGATYSGPDSFTYTATNAGGTSVPATVTITVTPQAPVAGAAAVTVIENSTANPVTLVLSGGTAASVAVASAATHGTATASGTSITYTPASNYVGSDSFTYTATNAGGTSAPATVTVTVNPPIPVANAVSATVAYGSSSDPITLNITGSAATSVAVAGAAAHGTATASGTSITYTPAVGYSGSDSFTYTASNVTGTSAPATVTITVSPQIPVAGAVSITVLENTSNDPVTLALSGGVATSVAIAGAASHGTAVASGTSITYTPSNGYTGSDSFTYTATNAGGTSAPATVTVTVNPLVPVVNAVSANVVYDSSNNAITLSISGAATSVAVASAAAHGVATASGTAITYTPTAGYSGPDSFTYTASNVTGTSAAATVTITVGSATITINASSPLTATVGVPYTQTYTFSGGAAPYTGIGVTNIPQGLSITGTTANSVTISGTPQAAGTFAETVSGTDSSTGATQFTGTRVFTLTTNAPLLVMSPATGTLTVPYGNPYSQTVSTSGGTAPYTYALSGALPTGLTFNTATGVLSGTPTQPGNFPITISSTDHSVGTGAPFSTSTVYTLAVATPNIVLSGTFPNGMVGAVYPAAALSATGGVAPYHYQVTAGAIPPGLALNANTGQLSGTPTGSGTYPFSVTATDTNSQTGVQAYTVTISVATLAMTPVSLPNGIAETAYSQAVSASGGITPYTYSVASGALPVGVTLNAATGALSGTPTVAGHFTFAIRVVDSSTGAGSPAMLTMNYAVDITAPAITVTPASLPAAQVGANYSQNISASGGSSPYAFSVSAGSLPGGLALSASGVLSGMPTTPGSYAFTVSAKDSLNFSGSQSFTFVVGQPVPIVVNDTASTPANTVATIPVTNNDTGPITSIAIGQAPTHGTASVSGLNVVYTPASNFFGNDTLTYTATGPGGTSAAATVSITVTPLAVPVVLAQTVTVLAGKAVTIHVTTGATGGPFTTVAIATAPASGVASVSGTDIVYTAPADASGHVSFSYTVANAFGVSLPATVAVTVNPLPVAAALTATAIAGTTVPIDLTAGARGGPFTAANLVSISPANAGSGTIRATATGYALDFTAAADFSGVAQLSFTLNNAYATSAPGTVTVTVTGRSDPSKNAEVLGILSAQADAARRMAIGQINNFQRRLESLHSGAGGSDFSNGITFSSGGGRRAAKDPFLSMMRGNSADNDERRYLVQPDAEGAGLSRASGSAGSAPGDIRVWTGGAVNFGTRQLGASANGIDFTTSGLSVGADKQINSSLAAGVGVGYGHDASDIGQKGSRSTVNSYNIAAYASYRPTEATYLDALIGYQWLSFDARRYVTDNGNFVTGSRDGKQWFGSLALGYEHRGELWLLSPYGRLDVANAKLNSYTEHGDPVYSLNYQKQTVKTSTGSVGLRAQYLLKEDYGTWMPSARVEYQRDFQGASLATMSYADLLSGPLYHATLMQQSRNHTLLGIGVQLQTLRGWTLRFEYQNLLDNSSQDNQSFLFGVEKKFDP